MSGDTPTDLDVLAAFFGGSSRDDCWTLSHGDWMLPAEPPWNHAAFDAKALVARLRAEVERLTSVGEELTTRVEQAVADKADQMRLADEHIVLFDEAEAEVERLTRELDDARRDLCQVYGRNECGQRWPSKTVEDAAARRVATRNGWGYLYVDEGTSSPRVDPEIIP